ncbi:MAG: hypothetical protein LBH92_01140 [Bacteroidales bacterium]|jgi:asparagine synthase (glutamine-hydrolysing)|nr:hypothetical protein [Bacteroidales bacterium]
MIRIELQLNAGYRWHSENNIFVKGFALDCDDHILTEKDLLSFFQNITDFSDFKNKLSRLNGIFSVIINKNGTLWAAVDRLRTFPLLYYYQNDQLIVSDDYRRIASNIDTEIDKISAKTLKHFGYVTGKHTLLDDVWQLQAGDCLAFENNTLKVENWHNWPCRTNNELSRQKCKKVLLNKITTVGGRLAEIAKDRPVAIPLSGGFDSRLIAFLLKLYGHEDVVCFTYGNPEFWEAKASKKIAEKLGYEWIMIDYKTFLNDHFSSSKTFLDYADFAGDAVSFPYLVEYFAAKYLKTEYKLPENTLFVPGHSGDTIAGSHLYPDMRRFKTKKSLATKILRKNGAQLPYKSSDRKFLISETIKDVHPERFDYSHLAHDDWNIIQRQSKQIINSSKIWDYFGYQFIHPLWDNDLTDFCLSMPFDFRVNKNLYDETLCELFAEYDLLISYDKPQTAAQKRKTFLKLQIKEKFPWIELLKEDYSIKNSDDFFYYEAFLKPLKEQLPFFKYNQGNAVMSVWYIQHVQETIEQLKNKF